MVESSGNEVRMTVEEKRKKEAMIHFLLNTYKKYYPKLLEKRELEAKGLLQNVSFAAVLFCLPWQFSVVSKG